MLSSVHELTHAVFAYHKIGKKFKKEITNEALPLLYEKLYILENPSDRLIAYGKYLDSLIDETTTEYQIGLNMREELLSQYNYNPKKTVRVFKKLSKKYR